jgi:RimJ/RimL family protein N-acetyltransferase
MPHLNIIPIQINHAAQMTALLQKNPEITTWLPFVVPDSNEQTEIFISHILPDKDRVWSIFVDEVLVGVVGLHQITQRRVEGKWLLKSATLGYWLSPEFQRQGIGTQSAQFAIDYAFGTLKLHKLKAQHIYENIASKGLLQKVGFRCTGLHRQEAFFEDTWWDEVQYELIAPVVDQD